MWWTAASPSSRRTTPSLAWSPSWWRPSAKPAQHREQVMPYHCWKCCTGHTYRNTIKNDPTKPPCKSSLGLANTRSLHLTYHAGLLAYSVLLRLLFCSRHFLFPPVLFSRQIFSRQFCSRHSCFGLLTLEWCGVQVVPAGCGQASASGCAQRRTSRPFPTAACQRCSAVSWPAQCCS